MVVRKWGLMMIGLSAVLWLGGCEGLSVSKLKPGKAVTSVPAATKSSSESADPAIPYEVEVIATGLQVPWEIDFAPDGRIFFTERGGTLRVMDHGQPTAEPVFSFAGAIYKEGEAGLLGFALDPNFSQSHSIYVYHSYMDGNQPKNRVVRLIESGGKARLDKVLLDGLPASPIHDGGRVKFGPDGMLYITNGDASDPISAQNVDKLAGKILRIRPDGTVPQDNPFPGSPVYSLGHRNPQGLAWHPVTKQLYSSEHGQTAHDEINRIQPGANYGWPLLQGDETEVKPADRAKLGPGPLVRPIIHSKDETWAPSGMTFVTKGPWAGSLLVATLRGVQVLHMELTEDGNAVKTVESLFKNELGRIRDVVEAPDGSLYLLTNNRDGRGTPAPEDDRIIRLKPKF
ncbi:PQQ-dependent sugar dehydrogenase [Paenibacillus cremeus]|uniref:PQQ-dependent sugar dehydrogenase n=1 Tax=Paenibacillus cremeus TaxID=2163881 RepID=A0A559KF95_9BACL|nr:PQQ-dependent sugar dehydrogenase [Paenibacillus cremeus]TVY10796.1 PQQ-dependent sugar dehydrogenase [Paenibacillus cremeus]